MENASASMRPPNASIASHCGGCSCVSRPSRSSSWNVGNTFVSGRIDFTASYTRAYAFRKPTNWPGARARSMLISTPTARYSGS